MSTHRLWLLAFVAFSMCLVCQPYKPDWIESCTGSMRVCQDGEDQFHNLQFKEKEFCKPNKLQRKTLRLIGSFSWSSVYTNWVAQIILEEQLQIPVKIVNIGTGDTEFYNYDNSLVDELDDRVYSWDALAAASADDDSMNCGEAYVNSLPIPDDIKNSCNPSLQNCKPCAHAMLQVWPKGQEDNLIKYTVKNKTAEYLGDLGTIGEFGWYASKPIVDQYPELASYRGLMRESSANLFKKPLNFGEFCNHTFEEWDWVVQSSDPFALDVDDPAHFCSHFFTFAMQVEYKISYNRNNPSFLVTRKEQMLRCAGLHQDERFLFYKLCSYYFIISTDLEKLLPVAEAALSEKKYDTTKLLYNGYFLHSELHRGGILHTRSCPLSDYDGEGEVDTNVEQWTQWGKQDGFSQWRNYDYDIITSNGLKLRPFNDHHNIRLLHETSSRLTTEGHNYSSPVLLSLWRPHSLFQRHRFRPTAGRTNTMNPIWGNFTGDAFRLAKVGLPEFTPECDQHRRNETNMCNTTVPENLVGFQQCGYEDQVLYKVGVSSLASFSPEAHYFLSKFQLSRDMLEGMLATKDYDSALGYLNPNSRARTVVCNWVRDNRHVWEHWLPVTSDKQRCLGELGDPLDVNNLHQLRECSGHGRCIPNAEYHNAGDCQCDRGYIGGGCDELVEPELLNVLYSDPAFQVVALLLTLQFLYCLYALHFVVRHGEHSVVFKTANTATLKLTLLSCIASQLGVLAWIQRTSRQRCIARPLGLALPYITVVACIFVKALRRRLKQGLNLEDIKQVVGCTLAAELLLFLAWFLVFPIEPVEARVEARVWQQYATCDYGRYSEVFQALLFVFSVLVSLLTCFFTHQLRNRASYFNDGVLIKKCVMYLFLVCFCGFTLACVYPAPYELEKFLIIASTVLVSNWVILKFQVRPKFHVHFNLPEINNMKHGLTQVNGTEQLLIDEEIVKMKQEHEDMLLRRQPEDKSKKHKLNVVIPSKSPSHFKSPKSMTSNSPSPVNPLRHTMAYRSPSTLAVMEKKYFAVWELNEQLMRILEEHHIDPHTGDMDEDFHAVLQQMEDAQQEEIVQMDELYQEQVEQRLALFEEKFDILKQKHKLAMRALRDEKKEQVRRLRQEAAVRFKEMQRLERDKQALKDTLYNALPEMGQFLKQHHLLQYQERLQQHHFLSMQDLVLITPQEMEHDVGMKMGHIRKLQAALKVLSTVSPKPRVSPVDRSFSLMGIKSIGEFTPQDIRTVASPSPTKKAKNRWKSAVDASSGRKYYYNKALGKSVWTRPKDIEQEEQPSQLHSQNQNQDQEEAIEELDFDDNASFFELDDVKESKDDVKESSDEAPETK